MKTPIQFHSQRRGGRRFRRERRNLLDTLRESVGDLSVKGGCWQGTCGTCTVLIDGVPRVSCVTLAETCAGKIDRDDGRPAPRRRFASAAKRFHGTLRRPVRLLHAGHADGGEGAA
jgi:ferredoxin